jgi:hypothetical protein
LETARERCCPVDMQDLKVSPSAPQPRPSLSTSATPPNIPRRTTPLGSAASASSTSTSFETARTRRFQRRPDPGTKQRIKRRRYEIAGILSNRSCVRWRSFSRPRNWERSQSPMPLTAG